MTVFETNFGIYMRFCAIIKKGGDNVMKDKKSTEHIIFKSDISDIDKGGAISATDYTGLIPSDPKSNAERESYEEILDYIEHYEGKQTNNL